MSNLLNRIKHWVSGDPFEDDVYQLEDEFNYGHPEHEIEADTRRAKKLKVVDHPNSSKAQVVVIEPRAFEEALEIIEHLKMKKSVILNLHLLDTAQSQRVVDFLSGATHALEGNQQRIGDGVFIFTPNNVSIRSESEKAMALSADAFWKQQGY